MLAKAVVMDIYFCLYLPKDVYMYTVQYLFMYMYVCVILFIHCN